MYLRYLLVTVLPSLIIAEGTYTFKDAKNWGKHYPGCNGHLQSPIAYDAKTTIGEYGTLKAKMKFTDFQKLPTKVIMKNTGRTVELKGDWSGKPPRFTGGPLRGNYIFEKITFRWAPKEWTEAINYDPEYKFIDEQLMDMHLYFYKENLKSFEKAESQKDGLAAFKLKIIAPYEDPLFNDLEKNIHKVQSKINSTAQLHPIPLASFAVRDGFQESLQSLFYKGSIDYPPCSESVTWFEPNFGGSLSESLINEFRKVKLEGGDVSNVRPPQPLNKRLRMYVNADEVNHG